VRKLQNTINENIAKSGFLRSFLALNKWNETLKNTWIIILSFFLGRAVLGDHVWKVWGPLLFRTAVNKRDTISKSYTATRNIRDVIVFYYFMKQSKNNEWIFTKLLKFLNEKYFQRETHELTRVKSIQYSSDITLKILFEISRYQLHFKATLFISHRITFLFNIISDRFSLYSVFIYIFSKLYHLKC